MKVGIVTFHRAINYGAVLQVFALYKTIEKLGATPEIIDYISPAISGIHRRFEFGFHPLEMYRYLRYGSSVNKRFDKFEKFVETMKLSTKVISSEDFFRVSQNNDAVICGSDQVWNLKITGNDFNYFLSNVLEPAKRIAYAASFGLSDYPANMQCELKVALERFNSISVRETMGQKIVESLIHKLPAVVLDPTLLLEKEEWKKFSEPYEIKDKYLLVYSVGQIEDLFGVAREISKKYGYRIAVVSHRRFRGLPGALYLKDLSPLEFVSVVDNAACVVTNSFHGTAFSVELEKKFIVVRRSETNNPGLNSRMETLLEKVGLTGQIYGERTTDIDELLAVDHSLAAERLAQLRKDSIKFLEKSLAE